MSIYSTLLLRRQDLSGDVASPNEVARLESLLQGRMPDLIRTYSELPICHLYISFRVKDGVLSAKPEIYESTTREEFDTDYDYEFIWMSPGQIVEEIEKAYVGSAVFTDKYVPIGMCSGGGDKFFLRFDENGDTLLPLYNVYYDWIKSRDVNPLPEQAVHVIWPSVIEVLKIAYFWH